MVFRFKSNVESTLSAFFLSGSVQFTFYLLDWYDRLRCKKGADRQVFLLGNQKPYRVFCWKRFLGR